MVEIIDVDAKKETAPELLVPYLQSGTLNFLIGSGASFPAIKTAGYIEAQINSLLTKGDEPAADLLSLEFIEAIDDVHEKIITNSSDPGIKQVVENYSRSSSLTDLLQCVYLTS